MNNIFILSQHNLGVGHFNRSSIIAEELGRLANVKIWLISCGATMNIFSDNENTHTINLPELKLKNINSIELISGNDKTQSQIELVRVKKIKNLLDSNIPRLFITEFFPFAPHRLSGTIIPILKYIKDKYSFCRIICSCRDIPISHNEKFNPIIINNISNIFNSFYDNLLIHSDISIISLKQINRFKNLKINCEIIYTGYVSKNIKFENDNLNRYSSKSILVTIGGGRDGNKIIKSAIIAAKHLPKLKFDIVCGPLMKQENYEHFKNISSCLPNVNIIAKVFELKRYFKFYNLIITTGGYNTLVETLKCNCNILVIPRKNSYEQHSRAKKLKELDLITVLFDYELNGKSLTERIKQQITNTPKSHSINLDGTKKTYSILKTLIN
jgi:predicted glycosyltransferase